MSCERMARDPILRWLKFLLTLLVISLWILSITFLYVACWIRDNLSQIVLVTEGTLAGDFYLMKFFPVIFPILIVVSCFLLVVGCLGCCGTVTDNQILLGWFFFSMLLIICLELSAGVWRLVNLNLSFSDADIEQLKLNGQKYGEYTQRDWFVRAWRDIHVKFQCCGIKSYVDWNDAPDILVTCCSSNQDQESCLFHLESVQRTGCGKRLMKFLTEPIPLNTIPYLTTIIGTMQIMCLILTLTLWLTMCLRKEIVAARKQNGAVPPNIYSTYSHHVHSPCQPNRTKSKLPEIPSKDLSDSDYITAKTLPVTTKDLGQTYCPKCGVNAYEEIPMFPISSSQNHSQFSCPSQVKRGSSGLHRSIDNCQRTTCSLDTVIMRNSHSKLNTTSSRGLFHPYQSDMKRCASSQLPTSYKFPSNSSVSPFGRACYSAGMPRKTYSSYTPRQRRRARRNDLRRLSPIRASGVGVASDSSFDLADIEKTVLLDNRLYNTEESENTGNESTIPALVSKLCSSVPNALVDTKDHGASCEINVDDISDDFEMSCHNNTPRNSEISYPTL